MNIIDRIKFDSSNPSVTAWKYPSESIRMGSQLIVNESQVCLFLKGGKILDMFGPGTHTLSTGNLPLLGKLISLPFNGKTPFAAEIWFINQTTQRSMKWGTPGAIQLMDAKFNIPVNIRAFGQWGMFIEDPRAFFSQLIGAATGADGHAEITTDIVQDAFLPLLLQKVQSCIAKFFVLNHVSAYDVVVFMDDISSYVRNAVRDELKEYGIEIKNFNIERISMPPEDAKKIQDIMNSRMQVEQMSTASTSPGFAAMRSFEVMEKAAENPNGNVGQFATTAMGLGMGISGGMAMGQQIGAQLLNQSTAATPAPAPAPAATPEADDEAAVLARLKKLKMLFEEGILSEEEYKAKRAPLLAKL